MQVTLLAYTPKHVQQQQKQQYDNEYSKPLDTHKHTQTLKGR